MGTQNRCVQRQEVSQTIKVEIQNATEVARLWSGEELSMVDTKTVPCFRLKTRPSFGFITVARLQLEENSKTNDKQMTAVCVRYVFSSKGSY